MSQSALVAYLSMEIGVDPGMPTYAGGLGILAGDTVRSCADLGIDMVAVTLVHRRGHVHQSLSEHGQQSEGTVEWTVESFAERVEYMVGIAESALAPVVPEAKPGFRRTIRREPRDRKSVV